jgi:hypothetical protein
VVSVVGKGAAVDARDALCDASWRHAVREQLLEPPSLGVTANTAQLAHFGRPQALFLDSCGGGFNICRGRLQPVSVQESIYLITQLHECGLSPVECA